MYSKPQFCGIQNRLRLCIWASDDDQYLFESDWFGFWCNLYNFPSVCVLPKVVAVVQLVSVQLITF